MRMPTKPLVFACMLMLFSGCGQRHGIEQPGLFQIKQDGGWGFIDNRGNVVVRPNFDRVFGSGTDSVTARSVGGWCQIQIGERGVTTTPLSCEHDAEIVENIGDRLYRLVTREGTTRIYDPEGRFRGKCDDDWTFGILSEGLLPIKQGGKWGVVDAEGRVVVKPAYDLVGNFCEGRAVVVLRNRWGYINRKGDVIVEPTFALAGPFVDGIARVFDGEYCWYIKPDGSPAFDGRFESAGSFSEGMACVMSSDAPKLYGYIDRSGSYLVEPKYEKARDYSEGLAAVRYTRKGPGGKPQEVAGYIDTRGRLVIQISDPETLYDFRKGLALVSAEKWMGYINKKGEWVWRTDKKWTPPVYLQ